MKHMKKAAIAGRWYCFGAEQKTVQEGCTPEEARRILTLQDYQDEDLCDELRDRGYHGEITKTKTIKI